MAEAKHDLVLQAEQPGGGFRCRGYAGVPSARRSLIAVVSSGSEGARADAAALGAELEAVLLGSGPEAAAADVPCVNVEALDRAAYQGWRKLLVLVGSADRPFSELPWYRDWQAEADDSVVMTVLPPGEFAGFFDATMGDEHWLRAINAAWSAGPAEVVPAVLSRAEVTTAESRVFLSYRRVETLAMAVQLFDALVHAGFDVFLDRFSIAPGYDFQRRLSQELQDKSMVVLLESEGLKDSKWTQHEITFANRHRLGLLALTLPGVKADDRLPADRLELTTGDFVGPPVATVVDGGTVKAWPALREESVPAVVGRIKRAHADALFRRRHRLRADLVAALVQEGVPAAYREVGPLLVGAEGREHLLWLTTRPAEVEDFRGVHGAHRARMPLPAEARFMIVGPQAALEPDRVRRLRWLREVTSCLVFDEGNLPALARRIAASEWEEDHASG